MPSAALVPEAHAPVAGTAPPAGRAPTVLVGAAACRPGLAAVEVCTLLEAGVRRAWPDAVVTPIPLVDGPGLAATLVSATKGRWIAVEVEGLHGERRSAGLGLLGSAESGTAVIELADCVPIEGARSPGQDPMLASSRGLGELIRAALDTGARRLIIGCGDARVLDAGLGMLQALGARALDHDGRDLGRGGTELKRLARIDLSGLDARIADTTIHAAVDPTAVLLGRRGVARVDGLAAAVPPWQVVRLERGLIELANALERATGHWVGHQPGSGACAGLGATLAAVFGAQLHPRFDVVLRYLDFERRLDECDVVIAASGAAVAPAGGGAPVPALKSLTQRLRNRPQPVVTLMLATDGADLGPGVPGGAPPAGGEGSSANPLSPTGLRDTSGTTPRPPSPDLTELGTVITLPDAHRLGDARVRRWLAETATASCWLLAQGRRMAFWTAGPALATPVAPTST